MNYGDEEIVKYDLHTHTKYSDGDLDINGNVLKAIEKNLDAIAITDHDNIDGWDEIDNNEYKIKVIKGVELSTTYKNASVHILGYYLNNKTSYEELREFLIKQKEDRIKRLDKIIELLKRENIYLTKEEILDQADGAVGRPAVAKAIIKKYPEMNYTIDILFEKYLREGKSCYVKTRDFETKDAIELLKRNNCLVVLAHPLLIKKINYKEILKFNIDGIECFYPYNFEPKENVLDVAKEHGLIITGGSDYHGPITRDTIGKAYLEDEYIKIFQKKINLK